MSQQEDLLRERLREAALILRDVRIERDALQSEKDEAIAIVGMGCRFPGGADTPQAYWDLLAAGRDAVTPLEPRWSLVGARPDEQAPRWAGLLTEPVDAFDPAFFGISPREARSMDPQHRLLLEVAWEALEDAGFVPSSLQRSRTGVFIGACTNDYARTVMLQPAAAQDAYSATGSMLSVAAGRLSYVLGLQGPCFTVDTACSSSLLAIHLACRSLRTRESELALAGGVNLLLSPLTMNALTRLQALSPDGRCRTFDAAANGFVRGEGCGLLVLKRASEARRDGDRIWALIRGSACNQDGRSTGLTTPNVLAQESLLRDALKDARVEADAVGYVEVHGTGTVLGDPIEVEALRAVVGRPRADGTQCVLGAVKTNIGHLEGAAGVASVIKAALVFRHERIPQNLSFRTLNTHIDLEGSSLRLAAEAMPWPRTDRPRFAGVSGFGLSGTNVHVVLQEAPAPISATEVAEAGALPFLISGRTEPALHAQAAQLSAHLQAHPELQLRDVAATLADRRTHFEHRAAIVAKDPEQLQAALGALAQGRSGGLVHTGAARQAGKRVFLFTGQGSQRPAMGRALYQRFPKFRDALDAVFAQIDPFLPRPLCEVMFADSGTPDSQLLDQTAYTQPALFALEVALYRLVESLGVVPELVMGHSVGELAAAHVAGVLSLFDACRLVAARGRLMQQLPPGGAMAALQVADSEVAPLLLGKEAQLGIAAVNGPLHTVISGEEEAVLAVARHFESLGHKSTRLSVSHAFHSPRMDAMAEAFREETKGISYQTPTIPLISSVTGELAADSDLCSAEYWVKQARAAVQFSRGMKALESAGAQRYLELGPRGVLSAMGAECLPEAAQAEREFIAALRGEGDEVTALLSALGWMHVRGTAVDFGALFRPLHPQHAELPTYPFQREKYWMKSAITAAADVSGAGLLPTDHPLLRAAVSLADRESYLFTGQLSISAEPWLGDHQVFSAALLPGTGFLELALFAAQALGGPAVEELSLTAPLPLPEAEAVQVQVSVQPPDAQGRRALAISSRAAGAPLSSSWQMHGNGVLGARAEHTAIAAAPPWPPAGAQPVDISGLYEALAAREMRYGPAFRDVRSVWLTEASIYAEVRLSTESAATAAACCLHPALLDAALHGLALAPLPGPVDAVYMPVLFQGVRLFATGASELRVRLQVHTAESSEQAEHISLSLQAWDGTGQPVMQIDKLVGQRVKPEQLRAARSGPPLYSVQWVPISEPSPSPEPQCWVLGGAAGLARRLQQPPVAGLHEVAERLQHAGAPVQLLLDATDTLMPADPSAAHDQAHRLLRILKDWFADVRLASAELCLITQGAVSTGPEERVEDLVHAPLWGLVRSARSEYPERRLRLLDVNADSTPEKIRNALRIQTEPELALRGDTLRAPRLVEAPRQIPTEVRRLRTDGTVLVTGGTGTLGALVARHLVSRHGIRHLLLISRQGAQAPGAAELAQQIRDLGAQVRIASCDMSDPQALFDLMRSIPDSAPLRAVFHCAAAMDDGLLSSLSPEQIDRVFASKLDGAWHLHKLTESLDLDAFVLFSSIAGILGSAGQAGYAAANTFLDALASYRRGHGLPGQSLAWGLWQLEGEQQGMTARLGAHDLARLRSRGLRTLSPSEGLALLDATLERPEPLLAPLHLDAARVGQSDHEVPPLLRSLVRAPRRRAASSAPVDLAGQSARLAALPEESRRSEVLSLVRREIGVVLGLADGSALTPERSLKELGMDSLMTVELRNRIQALLGVRIDLSAIWRLASVQALSDELVRLLATQARPSHAAASGSAPTGSPGSSPQNIAPMNRPVMGPLSAGQQRLYFLDRALDLPYTYNLTLGVRLEGTLDVDILRLAVEHLIARHEQLRVCFLEKDGVPRQRVLPWVEAPVEELALDGTGQHDAEGDKETALIRLIESEARKPFDLSRAPLFRILYIRLDHAASVLAIIWHHITTDGISMGLAISELSATYRKLRDGGQPDASAAPSYLRYVTRQSEWTKSTEASAQRSFWKEKLEGTPSLDLPTDRPSPRVRTERGGLIPFRLLERDSAALESLAQATGSTPFVIVFAAWSAVLSRYSGQQDFAIGTLTSGRRDPSDEEAVGFFVNTLPIRCPLQGEPTGMEYIQRLHAEFWAALEHQDLQLDEIVRTTAAERQGGVSSSPLFRVCMVCEDARWMPDSFAGVSVLPFIGSVANKIVGTSKFDLMLSIVKTPQGFEASLEYASDLFEASTVLRQVEHLTTLLSHLVQEPQRRLCEMPILTEAESNQLLVEWNDTTAPYPSDRCIHQLFEEQVQRTPDVMAVVHQGRKLTYRELNEKANQLAHHLRSLGVGPEVFVAICVERSLELAVGILGILKAGGAYVPLDPDSPQDRIEFMLQDTKPAVLLTQRALIPRLPRGQSPTICLDEGAVLDSEPRENPPCSASPRNLAYVIYTSGSTGRPKGVALMHHSVCNLLPALRWRSWGDKPLRAAMIAPIVFDMSVKPFFGALLYGHTLYVVDEETRRDGAALLDFYQRNEIEWSDCTPSILSMLIEAGLPTCQPLALRVLLCGGEALPTSLLASLYAPKVHPELRVINVYGPTETCVNVNANTVTAGTLDTSRTTVPLGQPFENTQLYILDPHLQPVPVGVPGELHIGGVGLARGYLNRPDLTAQKFIPNPFGSEPGSRLYKTGDLARFLPDRKIEFLGRMDHQIKLRGYRIELGEIESVLATHPDVTSCVVMAREDGPGSKRLVAYVVPQPDHALDPARLRAHLTKVLPDYMLPSAYVSLPSLPLSRNGKVDRKALPVPASERAADSFVPPSSPLECALADIFSVVLKVPRIGRNDDFFALGGDSLLAVRAVSLAQHAGFSLTVKQLFAGPTLAKLAASLLGTTRPTCLMTLQEGQAPGGVVLVPPAGGMFCRAHDIARCMVVSTSIFAVLPPLISGASERPDSVTELAALYARDITERIPEGPIALIGYSFGGPVALELAAQLSARSRTVELVVMLDSRLRGSDTPAELDPQAALEGVLDTLGLPPARIRGGDLQEVLAQVAALLIPDAEAQTGMRGFLGSLLENAVHSMKMLGAWQPHRPKAPVHLLRVAGEEARGTDYGWSQHVSLASIKTVPGQHYTILRPPNLETTMQAVRTLLDQSGFRKQ